MCIFTCMIMHKYISICVAHYRKLMQCFRYAAAIGCVVWLSFWNPDFESSLSTPFLQMCNYTLESADARAGYR